MLVPLNTTEWRLLRRLLRAAGKPLLGRDLRKIDMSRRSRDGSVLRDMTAAGLIIPAAGQPAPAMRSGGPGEVVELRTAWLLTAVGRIAAEYGEYRADQVKPGEWVAVAGQEPPEEL